MKTTYEKLHKYGINDIVFGRSKKKFFILYWILLIFLIAIILLIEL
jgi:uncharacterized membrane protein